jgi:hypothetical protein
MPEQPAMKFRDFIDLVLARLYELEREGRSGALFDLNVVAKSLKTHVPQDWVFDAGKVLESRGWAQVAFTFGGGCHARLTGEGRLYVEEERGTGIIKEYRLAPAQFVAVSGTGNQVVVGSTTGPLSQTTTIEAERAPAFSVLEELKQRLREDTTLTDAEKQEMLADVGMIEQQMRKREPNRVVLAALLEPLGRVASVAALVAELIRLFNP